MHGENIFLCLPEILGLTIRLAQSLGLHHDIPSSDPSVAQTTRSKIWYGYFLRLP